ncbi:MAG TPA: sugar ABC transporter ATP-binding protein [Firmicutes bacterium]|nr:sugar ABC transporter ATP-binding protein [Bacillota bacterium]
MSDLEIRGISKSYNGVQALQNVDFSANCGEVHALLGENGAGKSTFIKILSGAIQADSGTISLFGRQMRIKTPNDAINSGISTVYQELSLIPDLNVTANIFTNNNIFVNKNPKTCFGTLGKRELRDCTYDLFEKYKVNGIDPNALIRDISLANRQTIEILKILARDPKVIILDEATSALSENNVQWLLDIAKLLAKQGKIVIFISHRMSEIRNACDRITVFRNGRNVGEMQMAETNTDELVSLMLGRRITGYFPEKKSVESTEVVLEITNMSMGQKLQDINLKLYSGEVMGIGGLAGQGQAEILLALYGIYKTEGEVKLHGKKINIKSPHDCICHGIALVPEDRATQGLIMPFSIGYNISLILLRRLAKWGCILSRKRESDIVSEFMDKLKVKADNAETLAMNLSGGNQQKVVLAKLLAIKPKVMLLYDITRGIDVGTKKEIFGLIRELATKETAILFYSTDVEELVNVCDRVIVMHDGKIGAELDNGDLTKENILLASIGEGIDDKASILES